jgi:hypothetical protein
MALQPKTWASGAVWLTLALAACDDAPAQRDPIDAPDAAQDLRDDAPDATPDLPDAPLDPDAQAARFADLYCGGLAEGLCDRIARCGCPDVEGWAQTPDACRDLLLQRCLDGLQDVLAAIRDERAQADLDQLQACVDHTLADADGCGNEQSPLTANACRRTLTTAAPLASPCQEPICANGAGACVQDRCVPLPPLGEPCAFACAQGACLPQGDAGETSCLDPAPAGAPCLLSVECARGLACIAATCQAPRAQGEPCDSPEACARGLRCEEGRCAPQPDDCDRPERCGQGSTCFGTATRACAPPGAVDAPCEYAEQCQPGLFCDLAAGRCALAADSGEPCADGVACLAGLACDLESGRCGALPEQGEPCALGRLGPLLCADALGCVQGLCAPLPLEGEICTLDNQCAPGLGCDFTEQGSFCAPRRGPGEPCMADWICQQGAYCNYQSLTCAPAEPLGAPCRDGNECGEGRVCAPDERQEFVCVVAPQDGEPCFLDCAPGLLCATTAIRASCAPTLCGLLAP